MTHLSDRVDIDILEPHGPGELAMLVVRVDGHDEVRHFVGDEARRAIEEALSELDEAREGAAVMETQLEAMGDLLVSMGIWTRVDEGA